MAQSRRWVFTVNNWTDDDVAKICAWPCRYVVYGKEVGVEGTPHLQGFVIWTANKRLAACKTMHGTAHWEVAKGTNQQASDYCKKDGDFNEVGDMPLPAGQAEQERWKEAWNAAKRGAIDEVPDDIRFRYYRTCKEIAKDHMEKPQDAQDVTGVWYYGPPGVGKSHCAREDFPGAYDKAQNKWWDGYQNEEFVLLDDFDSKELGHLLKIWADKYSFIAETKGGALRIRPKKFIITSNYHPSEIAWSDGQMLAAILRRFDVRQMLRRRDIQSDDS